jgi:hypothetical protein
MILSVYFKKEYYLGIDIIQCLDFACFRQF